MLVKNFALPILERLSSIEASSRVKTSPELAIFAPLGLLLPPPYEETCALTPLGEV